VLEIVQEQGEGDEVFAAQATTRAIKFQVVAPQLQSPQ
jgi:hypothetical protein